MKEEEEDEIWLIEATSQEIVGILLNTSIVYTFTRQDFLAQQENSQKIPGVFTFLDRYSSSVFQGIMPDTGAAGVSTAGKSQFEAL